VEVKDQKSAEAAAQKLLECEVKNVILTMGASGYLSVGKEGKEFVAARKVAAADSTAAGDAFTGSLAVGLAKGQTLSEAARFANDVAAVSVTRMGAQPSMPTIEEIDRFIHEMEQ
jgi:ribokinase